MIVARNMQFVRKDFICLLILLCCCLIAWWPLTFHIFSLKNDALNYFLTIRYQISDSIANGYLPFWTPYLNLGYPLHADMQSGVWNPVVHVMSLFGPYTPKTLQNEFLFYIYLSGVGAFFLFKHFLKNDTICLMIATAYMLSGYVTDSAQFLNWISAASYLPFVFLFYYRSITENNWKTALICGMFYFLFFVSAYPADFILVSYLLFFVLIWYLLQRENRSKKILWQQLKLNALVSIVFLLLSLPAIISYVEFLPLTERGSGATYEQAMTNYLHPSLLFSFLTPLAVWKASFAGVTDPLERSCFFGLIPFALLLISFFVKTGDRLQRFLKWAFIISLIFSFGPLGGLRSAAYHLLPLMNTFRHPANCRLFVIFFGCLLAAFSLERSIRHADKIRIRKYIWIILLTCFAGLLVWALDGHVSIFSKHNFKNNTEGIKSFLDSLTFSDLLLINILLQIPFLAIFYFCFVKVVKLNWLLTASLVNSIIHTALYLPFSAVKKDKVSTIQAVLDDIQQKGYPIPDLNTSLEKNSEDGNKYFDDIGSYNSYSKKIGRVDYKFTPSNFLAQNEFWQNIKLRNILFSYPFFYKADTLVKAEDSARIVLTRKKMVVVNNTQNNNFVESNDYTAAITKFSPLGWHIDVRSDKPAFYCIFQNYYPRWQLFIDGQQQRMEQCNVSFMGFSLSPGNHSIFFKYKVWDLKLAYGLSCLATIIILTLLLFMRRKRVALQPL